jgi:3-methyl-2-oxobutanoate hydroxymethyltransferase
MPFMSYQANANDALHNAGKIMKETNCSAVKLEGGRHIKKAVKKITNSGIPVLGHLGLTPQSINQFGSYKTRGTNEDEANQIFEDAKILEESGVFGIVLEKIPSQLSKRITESVSIPTIGIGAGYNCDGQILVYTDMIGLTKEFNPRFVRRYNNLYDSISQSVTNYITDIKSKDFPNESESY